MTWSGPSQVWALLHRCFGHSSHPPPRDNATGGDASHTSAAQREGESISYAGQVIARDAQQHQRPSLGARAGYSAVQDTSCSTHTRAPAYPKGACTVDELLAWHTPRVICALSSLKRYKHAPQLQPGSYLDIPLPAAADGTPTRHMRAYPVVANEALAQCWVLSVLTSAAEVLQELVNADTGLMHVLSEAAATAVSLQPIVSTGGECQLRAGSRVYTCPAALVARCGTSIHITTTYLHDPEDGSLMPGLVLQLEGLAVDQSYHLAPAQDKAWPCTIAAQVQLPQLPPALGTLKRPRQRNSGSNRPPMGPSRTPRAQPRQTGKGLARSKAMLSSIPFIATLVQLDLQGQPLLDSSGLQPAPLSGRVLLQNQLSAAYWGRLTNLAPADSVPWWMLLELLGPEDLQSAVQHLTGVAQQVPQEQWVQHGWKKVVHVRRSCRSVGNRLRLQQRQQQQQVQVQAQGEEQPEEQVQQLEQQVSRPPLPSRPPSFKQAGDAASIHAAPSRQGLVSSGSQTGQSAGSAASLSSSRRNRRGVSMDEGCRPVIMGGGIKATAIGSSLQSQHSGSQGSVRQHPRMARAIAARLSQARTSGAASGALPQLQQRQLRSMHSFSCGENDKMRAQLLATLAGSGKPSSPSLKAGMDVGMSVQPSNRVLSLLATMDSVRSTPSGEDNTALVKQARGASSSHQLMLEQPRGSNPALGGAHIPVARSTSERGGKRLAAALAAVQNRHQATDREGSGSLRQDVSGGLSRIQESAYETRSSLPAFATPLRTRRRMSSLREAYRSAGSRSEQLPSMEVLASAASQSRAVNSEVQHVNTAVLTALSFSVDSSYKNTCDSDWGSCSNILVHDASTVTDAGEGIFDTTASTHAAEQAEEEKDEDEEGAHGHEEVWHEVQLLLMKDPATGADAVMLLQMDITARALVERRMAALTEAQLSMLENMFPRHVLEFLCSTAAHAGVRSLACKHDQVSILFLDIVGFTNMCKSVAPDDVMEFINLLFGRFDELCLQYHSYKLDTAGDAYIACGALMSTDEEGFITLDMDSDAGEGAANLVEYAQAMLRHARTVTMPNGQPTVVRVGIHTGSVVSGVTGTKLLKFSLYGDTMNTSSRMESTCKPGCIQISESTHALLGPDHQALFTPTGGVEVKGKGLMPTFMYSPAEAELQLRPEDLQVIHEGNESQEILLATCSRTTAFTAALGFSDTHGQGGASMVTAGSNLESSSGSQWATTQGPLTTMGAVSAAGANSSKSSLGLSVAAQSLLPQASLDRNGATAAAAAAAGAVGVGPGPGAGMMRSSTATLLARFAHALEDSQAFAGGRASKVSVTGRPPWAQEPQRNGTSAAADWGQAVNSWTVGPPSATATAASNPYAAPAPRSCGEADTATLQTPFSRCFSGLGQGQQPAGSQAGEPPTAAPPGRRATQDLGHLSHARRFSALAAAAAAGPRWRAQANTNASLRASLGHIQATPGSAFAPVAPGLVAHLALSHKSASTSGAREGSSPGISAAANSDTRLLVPALGVVQGAEAGAGSSTATNLMPGMSLVGLQSTSQGGPRVSGSGTRSTRGSQAPRRSDQPRSSVMLMQQILHLVGEAQEQG